MDKRIAKVVAMTLNCTPVGRKKRSIYHDDLWNIKYLPKFRWTHLTEKIGTKYILVHFVVGILVPPSIHTGSEGAEDAYRDVTSAEGD